MAEGRSDHFHHRYHRYHYHHPITAITAGITVITCITGITLVLRHVTQFATCQFLSPLKCGGFNNSCCGLRVLNRTTVTF